MFLYEKYGGILWFPSILFYNLRTKQATPSPNIDIKEKAMAKPLSSLFLAINTESYQIVKVLESKCESKSHINKNKKVKHHIRTY